MRRSIRAALCLLPAVILSLDDSPIPAAELQNENQPQQSEAAAQVRDWLETNVPVYMSEHHVPGFSIAVVQDGETIYAEGFGSRDPQRNLPATPDTLYGIGSLTKSFVAIGIMQLAEDGKIRLDDPVGKHIPFELGDAERPITIHHLLTHSLGIPSLATSTVALHRGLGRDTGVPFGSAQDFYRFVNGAEGERVAAPGERFFYHNGAFRMLAHIIQVKSEVPFHRYLKQNVMNPLGMHRSTMNVADFQSDPDHIVLHRKTSDGDNEPAPFPYPNPEDNPDFSFISGAGGIVSSVAEMTRYLQAHMDMGRYRRGRLAGENSFNRMHRLHIALPDGHYGRQGYGYGLRITPEFVGHKLIGHGGSIIVSTASMKFIPELKAGVVMMGNSSGMPYSIIGESVLAIIAGKEPAEVIPALQIESRMKELEGEYEVYRGLERLSVVSRGGLLYLETRDPFDGEVSLTPLIPDDPTLETATFTIIRSGLKSPVEFRREEDGSINLFVGRYCYHKRS